MNTSRFVLPAMMLLVSACTTTPEVQTGAEVTSAGIPSWQSPDLQPIPMPTTMTQPGYQPTYQPIPQPVPVPAPVPQPSYQSTPQPSLPATQAINATTEMVGQCHIVRDMHGKPLYAQMQKGCYRDATYLVGKSDTLFFIAFLAGKSPQEISALNNLSSAVPLKIGQQLRLK